MSQNNVSPGVFMRGGVLSKGGGLSSALYGRYLSCDRLHGDLLHENRD